MLDLSNIFISLIKNGVFILMAKVINTFRGKKADYLISELGGVNAVARICKIASSSVSSWRKLGVPRARLMYLRLAYPNLTSWKYLE